MDDTITVVGNVANDPRDRSQGGSPAVSFRLASTPRRYDRERNAWVDAHTNWYSVSAYRELGTHVLASVRKGQRVIVTGRLRVRDYDNNGRTGTAVDLDAEAVGHDLKFGTTVFSRDADGRASKEWDVATAPNADAGEDSWSAPSADHATAAPRAAAAVGSGAVDAPF